MFILAVDVGGTNVKILLNGESEQRRFHSGTTLTPELMVQGVKELAKDWRYDVVSVGYPGIVQRGQMHQSPTISPLAGLGLIFRPPSVAPQN